MANVLGARSALLSVLIHFFEHGRWVSPVHKGIGGQNLTAEDQLFVRLTALAKPCSLLGRDSGFIGSRVEETEARINRKYRNSLRSL
jgi:hypothetical protein